MDNIDDLGFIVYFIANYLNIKVSEKQKLLEPYQMRTKVKRMLKHIHNEMNALKVQNEIQDKVRTEIQQQQRDYYLRQQLRVLQNELDDEDSLDERWLIFLVVCNLLNGQFPFDLKGFHQYNASSLAVAIKRTLDKSIRNFQIIICENVLVLFTI